jgi:glycerophosphoryl diester phosphodiesterase
MPLPRSLIHRWAVASLVLACVQAAAFDLQGHRGARGLAPENTLAAFDKALDIGVSTLELDVVLTRDGVPVISHDPALNPNLTRDANGQWLKAPTPVIQSLSLAELQRYDVGRLQPGTRYAGTYPEQQPADGQRIPTLAQLFERIHSRGDRAVRFNVELKLSPDEPSLTPSAEPFVKAVLAVIQEHGLARRVTLQSFDWRILAEARRQAPDISRSALTARLRSIDNLSDGRWTAGLTLSEHGGSVPRLVHASGAQVWSPYFGELTPALLREARSLGLKVVPWTVNDPAQIDTLLGWGVDGIISDFPDRVRKIMAARGMALPPGR